MWTELLHRGCPSEGLCELGVFPILLLWKLLQRVTRVDSKSLLCVQMFLDSQLHRAQPLLVSRCSRDV